MAWSYTGASAVVESTTTSITLAEPTGVGDGDLLIAYFASRSTATTAVTGTGWTAVASQNNNNVVAALSTSVASGTMLYQVRSGAPNLTFTIPAGIDVCLGRMACYRGNVTSSVLDVTQAATTATGVTAVSVAGLTTTVANDIIITMMANGRASTATGFNATSPTGASGTASTLDPAASWIERADSNTATGADVGLAFFDGIKTAAGATGNFTVTAGIGGGHVVLAGAFKAATWVSVTNAWNISDKTNRSVVLTNADKKATNNAVATGYVRSTQTRVSGTAGKYYAEIKSAVIVINIGISLASAALTTLPPMYLAVNNGNIWINNVNTAINIGAPTAGDVICMAWDAGARLFWVRRNSGLWNNDAGADPATGTGGFDVSFASAAPHALWAQLGGTTGSAEIRTEKADLTLPAPVGFSSWMGEALSTIRGAKVWSGSAWVEKPAKVWSGSAWVQKPVKFWNGTAWVTGSGGAPAWTPATASTPAVAWFDATNAASITATGGLTTGNPVTQWNDLGTANLPFTPATLAPIYIANAINGKPGVSLEGGGNFQTGYSVTLPQPFMLVIIWKQSATAPAAYAQLWQGERDLANPRAVIFSKQNDYGGNYCLFTVDGGTPISQGVAIPANGGPYHTRIVWDGAFTSSVLNASSLTGLNPGPSGIYTGHALGTSSAITYPHAIISELFVIPYADHTAAAANAPTDATNAAAYTLAKWNI